MAKQQRIDKFNRLKELQEQVGRATLEKPPSLRKLTRKVAEIRLLWREYEDSHLKYVFSEKNETDKTAAQNEHENNVNAYDAVLDPAEDKIETLEAATKDPPPPNVTNVKDSTDKRITAAKEIIK